MRILFDIFNIFHVYIYKMYCSFEVLHTISNQCEHNELEPRKVNIC